MTYDVSGYLVYNEQDEQEEIDSQEYEDCQDEALIDTYQEEKEQDDE
jgi:hypothetical protein